MLGEYESLDKLNYLAALIDELSLSDQEKLVAIMEAGCDEAVSYTHLSPSISFKVTLFISAISRLRLDVLKQHYLERYGRRDRRADV